MGLPAGAAAAVFIPGLGEVVLVGATVLAVLYASSMLSDHTGELNPYNEEQQTHIWRGTADDFEEHYERGVEEEARRNRNCSSSSNLTQAQRHAQNLQASYDRQFRGQGRKPRRISESELQKFLKRAGFTLSDKSGKERKALHTDGTVLRLPNPNSDGFSTATIQGSINNLMNGGFSGGSSSSGGGASGSSSSGGGASGSW